LGASTQTTTNDCSCRKFVAENESFYSWISQKLSQWHGESRSGIVTEPCLREHPTARNPIVSFVCELAVEVWVLTAWSDSLPSRLSTFLRTGKRGSRPHATSRSRIKSVFAMVQGCNHSESMVAGLVASSECGRMCPGLLLLAAAVRPSLTALRWSELALRRSRFRLRLV
jgi:hypothetical protein